MSIRSSRGGSGARRGPLLALSAALALLAAVALTLAAAPASAVIVQLPSGQAVSYQPLRGSSSVKPFDLLFTNLDYNGGPVMAANTNYAVYWRPSGAPAYPPEYQSGVNQYLSDLAHDSGGHENTDSVSTQYNDAAGDFARYESHFGGALTDTDPYPANGCKQATICLTDAQLTAELSKFVKAQGLPTDLAHEYFLLTPEGVEDCFEASGLECSAGSKRPVYCAYHGNVPLGEGELIYSNNPYVTENVLCDDGNHPNGSTSDGVLEGGLSHEHNESITDPEPNNAWTDFASGEEKGEEIGDKCAESMGAALGTAPNGAKYNQLINGHLYWYQQEWSNQGHSCRQRFSFGGVEPTATFTSTPSGGNEAKFNASGSTAPGGVSRYSWQWGDGSEPEETTAPAITHTFPHAGVYLVALTVFASDGTSLGTVHRVATEGEQPVAAFSVTTAAPTAAQPVSFDGSASTAPAGPITSYSWSFGDGGAIGSGAVPSHTYAQAGAYTVTLTITDSIGATSSASQQVTVAPAPATAATTTAATPTVPATAPITAPPRAPDSAFAIRAVSSNPSTGAVTFTVSVADPGTFSWLLTFENGRFGVFVARAASCRSGYVRLRGRCRPEDALFAKGSVAVAAPGIVTLTIRPSAAAIKALRNALRQRKRLPVAATLTFQSSRGGRPVSRSLSLTVRPGKRR